MKTSSKLSMLVIVILTTLNLSCGGGGGDNGDDSGGDDSVNYRISGNVLDTDGLPIVGDCDLRITMGWTSFTIIVEDGIFQYDYIKAGDVTIEPVKSGWTFSPQELTYTASSDKHNIQFIGSPTSVQSWSTTVNLLVKGLDSSFTTSQKQYLIYLDKDADGSYESFKSSVNAGNIDSNGVWDISFDITVEQPGIVNIRMTRNEDSTVTGEYIKTFTLNPMDDFEVFSFYHEFTQDSDDGDSDPDGSTLSVGGTWTETDGNCAGDSFVIEQNNGIVTSIDVSGYTVSTGENFEWHGRNIEWSDNNTLEFDRIFTVLPSGWNEEGTGTITFSSENNAIYAWTDSQGYSGNHNLEKLE